MEKSKSLVGGFKIITGVDISGDAELVNKLKQRKFPLTKFIITYLNKIPNIKSSKREVILNFLRLEKKPISLHEIAEKYRYGVEVLRQFKKSLKTKPYANFHFIDKLVPFINPKSALFIDKSTPFVFVDDALASKVSKDENIFVSKQFLAFLMYQVNKNNFYLLFEDDSPRTKKENFKNEVYYVNKKFKANYLLNCKKIDKQKLFKISGRVLQLLSGKARMADVPVNLDKIAKEKLNEDYLQLLKIILKEGYGLEVNGNVVILKRNAILLVHEYIELILKKASRIMHMDEIEKQFKKEYPDVPFNPDSIRTNICVNDKIFFSMGKTGMYGLRIWEKTDKSIKGGTIREIVEEYLMKHQKPVHIKEIFKYVSKYRKTNQTSVHNNLMMMRKENIFTFYWGGFVGLTCKNYKETPARQMRQDD